MENIDYTEKIATFNLLVGNNNEEIALNYLTLSNWDETKAAMLYNQENKGANAKIQTSIKIPAYQNTANNNIYKNNNNNYKNESLNYLSNYNYYSNNYIEPKISNTNSKNNISKLDKYATCPIYTPNIFDSLNIFKIDNRGYFQGFDNVCSKCIKLYNVFINNLRTNVGIILLYNKPTYNDAINVLRNLNNNEVTKELLNKRIAILPLIKGCAEGDQIIKHMKIKNFPCILVCFYKNTTNFSVIKKIENVNQNIKLLNEALLEAHDLFNEGSNLPSFTDNNNIPVLPDLESDLFSNNINNNLINNINTNTNTNNTNNQNNNNNKQSLLDDLNNYLPEDINGLNRNSSLGSNPGPNRDSYSNMTDAEVLARQEREMKNLERMEEKKKLEEEKKEREKKEEEEKKKEAEMMEKIKADSILKILPEEPSDDNPDKCVILFRFPDGEKVVQRKFLKTDYISLLYLYVKSLGREIYSESEYRHFSLIQSFPFKNFDEVQNNTLEQEGLFPNAMLQIRASE